MLAAKVLTIYLLITSVGAQDRADKEIALNEMSCRGNTASFQLINGKLSKIIETIGLSNKIIENVYIIKNGMAVKIISRENVANDIGGDLVFGEFGVSQVIKRNPGLDRRFIAIQIRADWLWSQRKMVSIP
jgi:hypothetical protein